MRKTGCLQFTANFSLIKVKDYQFWYLKRPTSPRTFIS